MAIMMMFFAAALVGVGEHLVEANVSFMIILTSAMALILQSSSGTMQADQMRLEVGQTIAPYMFLMNRHNPGALMRHTNPCYWVTPHIHLFVSLSNQLSNTYLPFYDL